MVLKCESTTTTTTTEAPTTTTEKSSYCDMGSAADDWPKEEWFRLYVGTEAEWAWCWPSNKCLVYQAEDEDPCDAFKP